MSKHRKKPGKKHARKASSSKAAASQAGFFSQLSPRQVRIGVGAILVALVAIVAIFISGSGSDLTVEELADRARASLMLGRVNDAIVYYHRALNEEPENIALQHERYLAEQVADFHSGGGNSTLIAAAKRVEETGTYPLVGTVALARTYQQSGLADQSVERAYTAISLAKPLRDNAALIAASEVLSSYYRSNSRFDSAYYYAQDAVTLASASDDTFHQAIAGVSAGISALRIDSLDAGYRIFHQLKDYRGISDKEFTSAANIGLADYFERSGDHDSALYYLNRAEDRFGPGAGDALASYALQVLGLVSCGKQDYQTAAEQLQRSLEISRDLGNIADAIDVMNYLARCYRQARDWFNARKYYMAAGNLAERFEFEEKDLYSADLNIRFLKELPAADYRRAGEEGLELAAQFDPRT